MNNKKKLIPLLMITVFLMPSIVSTVSADEYETAIYYFDAWALERWQHDWGKMVDGDEDTYAWTESAPDEQYLSSNSYAGTHPAGTKIYKIELRAKAFVERQGGHFLRLEPIIDTQEATPIMISLGESASWSDWYEVIFISPQHPYDWDILYDLDCNVIAVPGPGAYGTFWCSIVQIRVTYG
jgi:hypothetical protein